ncbi:MAG: glycosyltransferase family 4 protein [Candidatus Omnitrophica bacterium]|nr:glycosyltransferase family 4 protein [Candidatus Omnitrophota bacterium]MBU1996567.1 glycosyltransferase family 4 protein [Candidatus Omnitrophota bacterium]
MIKILHIITRLDIGGSATNTIETVARLDKKKYQASLISGKTSDPDGSIIEILKNYNLDFVYMNELQREINPWLDLLAFIKLCNKIKKGNYDIVHTHSSKAGILGRWAAKLAGVKHIVHTPHGHVFHSYFSRFLTAIFLLLENFTANITDKIITLTIKGKLEHIKYGIAKPSKFVQIYSGVDFSSISINNDLSQNIKNELKIGHDAIVFGTVTRLEPIKGNDFLIEAMPEVIKVIPNAYLVIVGDGSEKEDLFDLSAALNVHNNIRFVGSKHNKYDFINMFDIFVLSSLNEGMGRAILEAMYCKKPVIASDTGGIPELVVEGKTGMLVTPGDSKALSEAMITLAKNKDRIVSYGNSGNKLANNMFSIKTMISKIENLYESLLNK